MRQEGRLEASGPPDLSVRPGQIMSSCCLERF